AIAMAITIMLIHTYYGYNAAGGPAGVGTAVGNAVRTSLIAVVTVTLLVSLAIYGGGRNFNLSGYETDMARAGSQSDTVPKRIAATFLALFIVVVVALSLLMFVRAFDNRVPLTVRSDRAGLVMDVDAAVRSRGVEIGNVTGIRQEFDGATLDIEVDPTALEAIPANADVSIGSNTIFGAKAVNFDPPAQPADTSLESGTVVETSNVTA